METLRTPDHRFENLPGFDFEPNYVEIPDQDGGSLRVHYIDEGDRTASPVLLMHGEPSWSYLYRDMVGPLVEAGYRVIVPDQVGFGRSDKPTEKGDYTYARHVAWMSSLIFDHLDLDDITLFCQDWGGLIGLRLLTAQPHRFARCAVANTGLPDGSGPMSEDFLNWQQFSQNAEEFPIGFLINMATSTELSADVLAAYDAPFPDDSYKAGARIWPSLVPTSSDDPEAPAQVEAWKVLLGFDRPFLSCFSDEDPITRGGEAAFIGRVAGTAGQPHTTIKGAGHFLQEDASPELAQLLIDWMK